ncbi:MAG: hypothetical protein EOP91_06335 [Lysobacteraceae bacterium]|nr:MAG: hypothetical protein EOP91_06335 [Xanthomonadaceae bacterium]
MNVFRLVVAVVFLVLGLLIGLQNSTPQITLKFFSLAWATTPGNAIILALLGGAFIGGVIVLTLVAWPLYSRLRESSKPAAAPVPAPGAGP